MKVQIAVVVALMLVLGAATSAGAAHSGTRSSNGNFCAASKGVAQYFAHLESSVTSSTSPASTKAVWGTIMSAEPALKSSAPRKLKPNVNKVFAVANQIDADLKKANWSVTGLLPYAATLTAQLDKVKPSIDAIDNYYRKTCKFKV
jgi:hypothetical protein